MSDHVYVLKLDVPAFDFPRVWYFDSEVQLIEAVGMARDAGMKPTWVNDYFTSSDEFKTALREAGRLSQEKL